MATMTRGTAGRSNTLAGSWERDVEDEVDNLIGDKGKLTKFSGLAGKVDAKSFVHEWIASEHRPMYTTLSATPSSATTDLTWAVTDDNLFDEDDIVLHESGETGLIASVVHGASPTITLESRSRGGTAAASVASGDTVWNMGPAVDDGSDLGTAYITQDVIYENPVQTYSARVEFDGTTLTANEKGSIYGGDFEARKRGERLNELLQKMDMNAIFGEAAETSGVGSDTRRTLGGLREFIPTATTSTIATLNQTALENYMADKLIDAEEELMVICSRRGATGLNSYSTSRIQATPGGKTLGYDLREYITPVGKLLVMPHYNLSLTADWNGLFLFVPTKSFKKAVYRPLKLHGDVNVGTKDVKTDMWLGAHTFSFGHPNHYGEINGVTAFA